VSLAYGMGGRDRCETGGIRSRDGFKKSHRRGSKGKKKKAGSTTAAEPNGEQTGMYMGKAKV